MAVAEQVEPTVAGEGKRPAREVAQRVFAAEFNASNLETKEAAERAPTYLVTPLGARVNRLFVVGVLTSNETVGPTGDMWRAQVTDPTGVFNVFAGQYQPEAARVLSELRPPCVVAVVGKARAYSPEEGVIYTSVRPESIQVVEVADRDAWIVEAARFTLQRLECIREATAMTPPSIEALVGLGYRPDVAEGAVQALQHYGPAETAKWAGMLRDALEWLTGAERREPEGFASAATFQPAPGEAPAAPRPAPAAAPPPPPDEHAAEVEEAIVGFVEKFDDGKGAHWKDIVTEAAKRGVTEDQVEEALNNLMDKGLVYEPVLGRLKRAD